MPTVDAVKACFAKYADFGGRATRSEYCGSSSSSFSPVRSPGPLRTGCMCWSRS